MPKPDWKHLGNTVVRERVRLRLTQDELKSRGGPSVTLVGQIERGVNHGVTARTKTALEDALNWERGVVDELLAGATEPRRRPVDATLNITLPSVTASTRAPSVGADGNDDEEFGFLTRVREDLTTEEMEALMAESQEYLKMLVRDIKRRRG